MKKSVVFMGVILGLFLTAFPWPETQAGATQSTPVLLIHKNSFKSFTHPTAGGKFFTFEGVVASTMADFTDGNYSSFVMDVSNMGMASTLLLAYNSGSKLKIDYAKDTDFMSRPVMNVKVLTLIE